MSEYERKRDSMSESCEAAYASKGRCLGQNVDGLISGAIATRAAFVRGADWAKNYFFTRAFQCPCCGEKYTVQGLKT